MFPETYMLGIEIRVKVSDYVMDRIKALRTQNPGTYGNIACIRSNAMKYLPNYFAKGQVCWNSFISLFVFFFLISSKFEELVLVLNLMLFYQFN